MVKTNNNKANNGASKVYRVPEKETRPKLENTVVICKKDGNAILSVKFNSDTFF